MTRNVSIEKLDDKQLEKTIDKISAKINKEVDATCSKVNQLLARYGLQCKMQIVFEELDSNTQADSSDKISSINE